MALHEGGGAWRRSSKETSSETFIWWEPSIQHSAYMIPASIMFSDISKAVPPEQALKVIDPCGISLS
ncbi:unnamed protein product [Boreogadus saida]